VCPEAALRLKVGKTRNLQRSEVLTPRVSSQVRSQMFALSVVWRTTDAMPSNGRNMPETEFGHRVGPTGRPRPRPGSVIMDRSPAWELPGAADACAEVAQCV
jgi:hypothetical protein